MLLGCQKFPRGAQNTGGNVTVNSWGSNAFTLCTRLCCSSDLSSSPKVWELAAKLLLCCALTWQRKISCVCLSVPAGHESPAGSRCVISEFIRPLQISADKPEQLSVKPTLLAKARAATPRCRFDSDVSPSEFYTEKLIWDEILGSCTAGIPWAYLRIITGNICMFV